MNRTARIIVTVAAFAATIATGWHTAAHAQPRDDWDVWVHTSECALDVTPSGAPLEVTVDGRGPVTIEAPQTIHIDGPALVVVGHRTPKQYDERTYEVPECPTTTVPPDTTTTTTVPPSTSTTNPPTDTSTTSTTTTAPPTTSSTVPETSVTSTTTPPTVPPSSSVPPTTTTAPPELPATGPSDVLLALGVLGTLMVIGGGTLLLSRAGKE